MSTNYKNLLLEREMIISCLSGFHPEGKVVNSKQVDKLLLQVEYALEGQPNALLNIYNVKDGTVTLHPNVGKNHALSTELAAYIADNCKIQKNFSDKPLRVPYISEEDLNTAIEFLQDGGATAEPPREIHHGMQVKVRGKYGDVVSINRYNTGTLVINGRAHQAKTEIIEVLSKVLSLEQVVTTQLDAIEVQLNTQDVLAELKNRLPSSFDFLGDTVVAILSPCIALNKIEIEVQDYSFFVFPAFRGFEGFIKRIFESNGLIADANSFGSYFEKTKDGYKLLAKHEGNFTPNIRQALGTLYDYYKANRHGFFHVDGVVAMTKLIEDRQEADEIVLDVFAKIEEGYVQMSK